MSEAQPPPSVPAGAEVAEVLAGLVQEMRLLLDKWGTSETQFYTQGVRRCITLVEAAQAATGARAAGREGWSQEKLLNYLDAAHGLICNAHRSTVDYVTEADGASPGWAEAARRWIDAYPPTPAPVAPGVAELLAEGERQGALSIYEIRRLLAPEGGQS